MQTLRKKYIKRYALGVLVLVIAGTVWVQCAGIPKIPGLNDILKKEPPVTTSLADAVTEVPFLDDYNPKVAMPMSLLPRTPEGGFILEEPGNYIFEAQSYCLKAGSYAPDEERGGEGYLYAPQKGPQADIVRNILERSFSHPEIPQRDIQVLLWAILARTKISDMSPEMQQTAAKLLTAEELFRINGGALGLIPEALLDKAFAKLPSQVRQVLEAEARLRGKLTEAQATYEELERIAVLFGDPPPQEGDREVPRGRWSLHPNGFFIRYFPRGYQEILIELSVPEPFQIERDQEGRITVIADGDGNRIETNYDDTIEPLSIDGEPALKAYAFHSIRFEGPDPDDPRETMQTEWTNVGWTLVGVPAGGGHVSNVPDRFSDLEGRYEWVQIHTKEVHDLIEGFKKLRGDSASAEISPRSIETIIALGHYATALQEVLRDNAPHNENWIVDPLHLVKEAWQYAVNQREDGGGGGRRPFRSPLYALANGPTNVTDSMSPMGGFLASNHAGGNGGENHQYNPSGGMAQPGQGGRQRLNQSGRPTEKQKCLDKAADKLKEAIEHCYAGHEGNCDMQSLKNCVKLYPKGKRYKCIYTRCSYPKGEDALMALPIQECIVEALKAWLKDEEQCK